MIIENANTHLLMTVNFLVTLLQMDFKYINNATDFDHAYNKILDDTASLVEKHVPTKRCTKKELKLKAKPWINKRIQKNDENLQSTSEKNEK